MPRKVFNNEKVWEIIQLAMGNEKENVLPLSCGEIATKIGAEKGSVMSVIADARKRGFPIPKIREGRESQFNYALGQLRIHNKAAYDAIIAKQKKVPTRAK